MKSLSTFLFGMLLSFFVQAKDFNEISLDEKNNNPSIDRIDNSAIVVKIPEYMFSGTNNQIELTFVNPNHPKLVENNYTLHFIVNGGDKAVSFDKTGKGKFDLTIEKGESLSIFYEDFKYENTPDIMPLWYVLSPIALVIVLFGYQVIKKKKEKKYNASIKPNHPYEEVNSTLVKEVKEIEEEVIPA